MLCNFLYARFLEGAEETLYKNKIIYHLAQINGLQDIETSTTNLNGMQKYEHIRSCTQFELKLH